MAYNPIQVVGSWDNPEDVAKYAPTPLPKQSGAVSNILGSIVEKTKPYNIFANIPELYGKATKTAGDIGENLDAMTQLAGGSITKYTPIANIPDIIYGGVNTLSGGALEKKGIAPGDINIFHDTAQKAVDAGQKVGGDNLGYALGGAFESPINPTRYISGRDLKDEKLTQDQQTARDLGSAAFSLAAVAPIGGGTPTQQVVSTGIRAIQGAGIGGAGKIVENAFSGKDLLDDWKGGVVKGLDNSWTLALTNAATDKVLSSIAPGLTEEAIKATAGQLANRAKYGADFASRLEVWKPLVGKFFARALAEVPAENTAFTALDQLNGKNKADFITSWVSNLPGTTIGNLAYAVGETGVRGTYNFNKDTVDAGVEALKKTLNQTKAILGTQGGGIDVTAKVDLNKPAINTPDELARTIQSDYKINTTDGTPQKLDYKTVSADLQNKYSVSPELVKQLESGKVLEDANSSYVIQNNKNGLLVSYTKDMALPATNQVDFNGLITKLGDNTLTKEDAAALLSSPQIQGALSQAQKVEAKLATKGLQAGDVNGARAALTMLEKYLPADMRELVHNNILKADDLNSKLLPQMQGVPLPKQVQLPDGKITREQYLKGQGSSGGIPNPKVSAPSVGALEIDKATNTVPPENFFDALKTYEGADLQPRDPVTPDVAKELYRVTGKVYPVENVLKASTDPITMYDTTDKLTDVYENLITIAKDNMSVEDQAGLDRAIKLQKDMVAQTIKTNIEAVGYREGDNILGVKFQNKLADKEQSIVRELMAKWFPYQFTDVQLDDVSKQMYRTHKGLVDTGKLEENAVLHIMENNLGRPITDSEFGALLRQDVEAELKLFKDSKGELGTNVGEDLIKNQDELIKSIAPLHEYRAALVLEHAKILSEEVASGRMSLDQANASMITTSKEFGENMYTYVRHVYLGKYQQFVPVNWYQPFFNDMALKNPSILERMTDEEWGRAYISAVNAGKGGEISMLKNFVPEEFRTAIANNDIDTLAEIGKGVKEIAGVDKGGASSYERTINYLARNISDLKMFSQIAQRLDITKVEATDGFRPLSGDKQWGSLANLYVRNDIANELEALRHQGNQELTGVSFWWKAYMSMWKAAKVPFNIASYFMNTATGLTTMNNLAGKSALTPIGAWNYQGAVREYFGTVAKPELASEEFKMATQYGLFNGNLSSSELKYEFINEAINTQQTGRAKDVLDTIMNVVQKAGSNYEHIDNMNKYYLFKEFLKDGMDGAEAVKTAQKYQLNYDLVPNMVAQIAKSDLMPFIRFPLSYFPMLVETTVTRPWRLAELYAWPLAIGAGFAMYTGLSSEEIQKYKPAYQKDNPLYIPVWYDEKNKEIKFIDFAQYMALPYRFSKDGIVASLASTTQALSNTGLMTLLHPGGVISSVYESVNGRDNYGRDLNLPGGETSIDHLLIGVLPIPMARQIYTTVRSTYGRSNPYTGEVMPIEDALLRFAGINLNTMSRDQFLKNINGEVYRMNQRRSYYNKLYESPDSSQEYRQSLLEKQMQEEKDSIKRIKEFVISGTNVQDDEQATIGTAVIYGLIPTPSGDVRLATETANYNPNAPLDIQEPAVSNFNLPPASGKGKARKFKVSASFKSGKSPRVPRIGSSKVDYMSGGGNMINIKKISSPPTHTLSKARGSGIRLPR
jgi:hypothetical protein